MKRLSVVFLLAALFSAIALYIIYPDSIEKLWLWFVGLIGVIIAFIQKSGDWIETRFKRISNDQSGETQTDTIAGEVFVQIFRYSQSGNRILGMAFIGDQFIGITSENAMNKTGRCQLNIRNNSIILSGEGLSARLVAAGEKSATLNDILISADPNNPGTSSEMIYNKVFELIANCAERGEPCLLEINNTLPV